MNDRMLLASVLALTLLGHPSAASSKTHVIVIERMAFQRIESSEIAIGDTIEWRNRDVVPHTATLDSGRIDARLAPGEVVRTEVTTSGVLEFVCLFHPAMSIILEVK